ncbi:tetratricopeptide repeat protein [Collimonas antrihumi]|uniref:tetratricopeptide repeat protein n=1 Tax=Collimonas antrihumi TaxID=1940615 RepID=UPI001B8B4E00|nr:tetratricopeptide repeat protein [Collimonas antrihumi]
MRPVFILAGALAAMLLAPLARAEPFKPVDDAMVLEMLPRRDNDALNARIAWLRGQLNAAPGDFKLASKLSEQHLSRFRRDSDPRDLGQAEAVIAPWLNTAEPPALALILRASVQQSNHQFEAALSNLDRAMNKAPGNPQALLMRASILQVQGRYAQARESCGALIFQDAVFAGICLANVMAVSGQPDQAMALLQRFIAQAPVEQGIQAWAAVSLAEAAASIGQDGQAETALRLGLAANPRDAYLKTAMADFLLEHHRPREVLPLLADDIRNDNLLLRLAMAEQQLASPDAKSHIEDLQARFAAAAARGDRVHLREEAMFRLTLLNQPEAALQLAQANWIVQKELADCRILLATAAAAHQPGAAKPALDWLTAARLRAPSLLTLAQRVQQLAAR